MKSDITRDTFDRAKQYTRVLQQQGRVQLDADWNEQVSILLHYLETLAADLIGPHGGPQAAMGFSIIADKTDITNAITAATTLSDKQRTTLTAQLDGAKPLMLIGAGRYYVDGLLCENLRPTLFTQQEHYPLTDGDAALPTTGANVVYLDVCEHYVDALQDPHIREVALGGADTCGRAQIVWQIKTAKLADSILTGPAGETPDDAKIRIRDGVEAVWPDLVEGFQPLNRGTLKAIAGDPDPEDLTNPCVTAPEARYRGLQNQLYRVEVHQGGPVGKATFKWSRDNGSGVAQWIESDGNTLLVNAGHGFEAGQWIELSGDASEGKGTPGTLVKLSKAESDTLTLAPNSSLPSFSTLQNPIVRRWDQKQNGHTTLRTEVEGPQATTVVRGDIVIQEGVWQELEKGVQVQFQAPATAQKAALYRTGDYWLIPARTATGKVEWPQDETEAPLPLPPHGVEHHYAPLVCINVKADGQIGEINADCRRVFKPLGE